jgi:uncharacterized protein involved in type VI secretion and phage assembly
MTHDAIGVIRAIVREQLRGFKTAELGVVTAAYPHSGPSDKDYYQCDVQLRDSGLELRRVAVATSRVGMGVLPDVGNLVLVQFIGGAPDAAVIVGCLYNADDEPPKVKVHEAVYVSPHSQESGIRRLHLELPNQNSLTLDDDKLVLTMGGTTVSVTHDGDVEVTAAGAVKIVSDGDTRIEASGNISLGTSTGDVTIEGLNVTVKASAAAKVEGAATATLKGAAVSLAGQTQFSPA